MTVTDPSGDVGDGLVSTVGEVRDLQDHRRAREQQHFLRIGHHTRGGRGLCSGAELDRGCDRQLADDLTLEGVDIATVIAQGDVTLVLTKEVGPNDEAPMFRRVNDPIAFEDNGDVNEGKLADIRVRPEPLRSSRLPPTLGQWMQIRTLSSGRRREFLRIEFWPLLLNDIGSTSLLPTIPTDALATFETQIDELNLLPPTDVSLLVNSLVDSSRATASACNTTAASSSRSTAASQRGEEEVAEVDEQAFVNLVTFDAPPDSVRLPEDQVQLAIDREDDDSRRRRHRTTVRRAF